MTDASSTLDKRHFLAPILAGGLLLTACGAGDRSTEAYCEVMEEVASGSQQFSSSDPNGDISFMAEKFNELSNVAPGEIRSETEQFRDAMNVITGFDLTQDPTEEEAAEFADAMSDANSVERDLDTYIDEHCGDLSWSTF